MSRFIADDVGVEKGEEFACDSGGSSNILKRKMDHNIFGLDTQFQSCRKLMAKHINTSITTSEKNGCYEFFYCDRPVSRVEAVGVVTGIRHRQNKCWITIDDGSGLVRCVSG